MAEKKPHKLHLVELIVWLIAGVLTLLTPKVGHLHYAIVWIVLLLHIFKDLFTIRG